MTSEAWATLHLRRLAAACVSAAPFLPPLGMLIGLAASGEARGMGGIGVLVLIYVWGALAGLVALICLAVDLVRATRGKPPVAFAYAGLVVEGARAGRQALAAVLVLLLPPLAGWAASATCGGDPTCSLDLESALLWYTPLALWLFNGLFWLGPSARTLGDRLAGGRLVPQPRSASESLRPRSWWPDALLVVPPLLLLPVSGGKGGLLGLLVALAISATPVGIMRWGVAFTPQHR